MSFENSVVFRVQLKAVDKGGKSGTKFDHFAQEHGVIKPNLEIQMVLFDKKCKVESEVTELIVRKIRVCKPNTNQRGLERSFEVITSHQQFLPEWLDDKRKNLLKTGV